MDEEIKKSEEEQTPINSGERIQPAAKTKIELANEAAERAEKAVEEALAVADRLDAHKADQILGGKSEAGMIKPKEPKMTDLEYAQALSEGKVNPLKEDGYIC